MIPLRKCFLYLVVEGVPSSEMLLGNASCVWLVGHGTQRVQHIQSSLFLIEVFSRDEQQSRNFFVKENGFRVREGVGGGISSN